MNKLDLEDLINSDDDDDTTPISKLYSVLTLEDGLEIYLGDAIEHDTYKYLPLLMQLRAAEKEDEINFYMSCSGGSVGTAQRICHAIRRCEGKVTMYVDAPCASAGSLVALAGDSLIMAKDAHLMFHGASGQISGNVPAIKAEADRLKIWCRANDMEFAYPFLSKAEVNLINDGDTELHIYGTDKDLKKRIKRHFK